MSTIVPISELVQVLNRASREMRADSMNGQADGAPFLEAVADLLASASRAVEASPAVANPTHVEMLHSEALRIARAYLDEVSD